MVTGTCPVVITRTYTVTDECGNASTASYQISVDDTTPPTITGNINDITVEGCDQNAATVPAPATTVAQLEDMGLAIEDACTEDRSEERRDGKECSTTCRSRWSPYH